MVFAGDTSGQIDPLLSSFDEPAPLTAIPTNTLLNRLEEESALIEEYDTDTDIDSHHRRQQEDEDAKIPLLTSPEVKSFPHLTIFQFIHIKPQSNSSTGKLKIYLELLTKSYCFHLIGFVMK